MIECILQISLFKVKLKERFCVKILFLYNIVDNLNSMQGALPFVINLNKTTQGYSFASVQQTPINLKAKKEKAPAVPRGAPSNKNSNRLMKQIEQINKMANNISEEPIPNKQLFQQEPQRPYPEPIVQQEIDCQIDRPSQLPASPATWFSLQSIDQYQIDAFPDFFTQNSHKNAQLYKCYRNFMVEAYHRNPNRHLTFIACRRVLRGDVSCLMRIHSFLVSEGIINYCVDYAGNYSFQIHASNRAGNLSKQPQSIINKLPEQPQLQTQPILDTDSLTVTTINKAFSRNFRVYCSQCKLLCGVNWYHSEDDQSTICFQCFNSKNRKQGQEWTKTDIVRKMEQLKDARTSAKNNWGYQDNVKLLDFMSNAQGKSWNDFLQQYEGRRTLEDIIVQFMQFPINNFDPAKQTNTLRQQVAGFGIEQQIDSIFEMYQQSAYAQKMQEKQQANLEQAQQLGGFKQQEASNFHAYSRLILEKYSQKIKCLTKINLAINEQPLCTRIRYPQAIGVIESQEFEEDQQNMQ